jgi:predicted phosphodiesterase
LKYHSDHVLVVSDLHIPFEHKDAFNFCIDIRDRVKCGTIVMIGDLVDNHAINYHEHDPNGRSPIDEMREADKHLQKWFKAFPSLFLCRGNHDCLIDRKSRTVGLPERAFKPFREIWQLPQGWKDDFSWEIDNVRYQHGTGYSGDNAHLKAAYNNRQSTVIGHTHSAGAVGYMANEKECIFGANVGCLIDRKAYAFEYGRDFRKKPILSVGVVTDEGKYCQIFPMSL